MRGGHIARDAAYRLQRHRDDRIARHFVRMDIALDKAREGRIGLPRAIEGRRAVEARIESRWREIALNAFDSIAWQDEVALVDRSELALDRHLDLRLAHFMDEDFDTRLELVVAPSLLIVDAKDRFDVSNEIGLRQEVAHLLGDHRRAALAAADPDGEAEFARLVALHFKPNVVHLNR